MTPPQHNRVPHSHGHHTVDRTADQRLLGAALGLIVTFMVAELVVGLLAGSLALVADSGHMLTDAGTIALSIWAVRLATRPAVAHWTFGFKRAEIISAAVNGITLALVAAVISVEAILRLVQPTAVRGSLVIVMAAIGVVVNVLALVIVVRASQASLNVKSAYRHLVTDLWAFVGTLIAGIVIVTTGWRRADPVASLIVAALMLRTSWTLVRDSGRILLEGAPAGLDLNEVREHLLAVSHVIGVHDLHVWVVTSDLPALSAHVVIQDSCFFDGHAPQVLDQLQECLVGHFDLAHSTFQLESSAHADHEDSSH